MGVLQRGSSGAIVERLQDTIDATVDGRFGPDTEKKLRAWQKANGFKVDGRAGPDLQHEMGLSELISLEPGDSGELVKLLQDKLEITVDGVFGQATADAVAAYQQGNGLEAGGVADPATLALMQFFHDDETPAAAPAPAPVAKPAAAAPRPGPVAASASVSPTGRIATWAYQLFDIDPAEIATLPVDLVVIDYSKDGDAAGAFGQADLARMKQRPPSSNAGGGTKQVISYMSIGEAEDYRFYWQQAWSTPAGKPAWLDDENPDWEGNFKVRYWDPEWKAVISGSPRSYLDQIIAAGFDGVYLDIIDAFENWRDVKQERPDADRDMIQFVTEIATYARRKRPGFLIVPQNGEALLADEGYRKVISAQAKEDLFFGLQGDGRANKKGDVKECMDCIAPAAEAGLPILVVEYLDDDKKRAVARTQLADNGFAAYFAPRKLDDVPTEQFGV